MWPLAAVAVLALVIVPAGIQVWAVRLARRPDAARWVRWLKVGIPVAIGLSWVVASLATVEVVSEISERDKATIIAVGVSEAANQLAFLLLCTYLAGAAALGWATWRSRRT